MVAFSVSHVLLETPARVTVQGVSFAELFKHLGTSLLRVQPSVSWNVLVGDADALRLTAVDLRTAVRRWFSWEQVLVIAAHHLNMLSARISVVDQFMSDAAVRALDDDWPARVVEPHKLLDAIREHGRILSPCNEHSLLWLVLDALRSPWGQASEQIGGIEAQRRFARLVMVAADGFGLDEDPTRSSASAEPSGTRAPFTTAQVLLPAGRLGERDDVHRYLVRAFELYCELLPKRMPESTAAFSRARGIDIADWIVGACTIVTWTESETGHARPGPPVVDLGVPGERPQNETIRVIEALAKPREHFESRIHEISQGLAANKLPIQVLREAPILKLDDRRFLILYDDFLLAQADDGIWYGILAGLGKPGSFFECLGLAVEDYAERVLRRCATGTSASTSLARVKRLDMGEKRCDFVLLHGGLACLIEAKRVGLAAVHLSGGLDMVDRLAKELAEACRQVLITYRAIRKEGMENVADVATGTVLPERVIAIIVTHRPVFAWFSTRREIVPADIRAEWDEAFAAPPAVWSLAELELFEAAIPEIGLTPVLRAIADNHPMSFAGLADQLARYKLSGRSVSPYYVERFRAILADRRGIPTRV